MDLGRNLFVINFVELSLLPPFGGEQSTFTAHLMYDYLNLLNMLRESRTAAYADTLLTRQAYTKGLRRRLNAVDSRWEPCGAHYKSFRYHVFVFMREFSGIYAAGTSRFDTIIKLIG